MTEPLITPEIDALIDEIEASGNMWYIIGGSQVVEPSLSFSLINKMSDTFFGYALEAMVKLNDAFNNNADIRKAMIENAISIGAYYVELGNNSPVIGEGRTVQ